MNEATSIEPGDRVRVFFNKTSNTGLALMIGTVVHTPSDTGDMWILQLKDGLMYINPNSASLEAIGRIDEPI